ncbi:bifunctional tRNA (5-methylaminomethyl-2-thiouridine)(34)-methyltransferase MnmD/FAD-dependent 5-carboxymethylaminomethyl-2-thiouridine(34) oxidoreductase MnmC [Pseudomonas sp. gcc21]|uniref:bifunctional tRNA (5-methylaminomethyl-2-thiouridine)(34)-methyltransferase MnmD/FAD-dependent 5-carboxymethylaminomethyl-2-thiouridine(34) oxidoreductase MnmC n=1 Tax=Pseudomonas sp. gcc21 TaxID=2726989 RepID=UPI001451994F|nr:bifunctional tRNA (5-methylaminomethyl-2-thiouridine)(34)-methyltransferase MnmD/FAD-dependent 5-carboxymethylaminomethyl-2-thiouridine(34) oxidoreductase MnmC [Pseudomonas sp. gcc21]QJD57721.1 bifunctional tRNA (5-methylaminomethyl-2-thiouridine)(34)-methyltransferase MnmD/FAD-dependent 5-carboxymethylaminomethyl-2-thiouridine(34) oxidoreductase MnmC [Pseudomonas sp. gcc21]
MTPTHSFAHLAWADDGQPFSVEFDDVYFSRESGLEETRHVFLQHNALPERWAQLRDTARFCIAETGFGTGLNFLCAWQLWDSLAPAGARLHFVSTEKYPLSLIDMQRALALWPELEPWSAQLLAQYSDLAKGWQHFSLADGRVTLTLLVGDLLETLPQLEASVDAWFLDGFAPAKNPDMWQQPLYDQMARLSSPGATVATFTSVGAVRRGLQAAGFNMRKVKGFGRKREMLAGTFVQVPEQPWQAPWFARPAPAETGGRRALIIGAGLAGCCTAFSLARRGWRVTVIERHASEAQEASGNPQGILYCKLSPHQTRLSRFIQASYAYSLRLLHETLAQNEDNWAACGVLQLSADLKESARLAALAEQGYPDQFLHGVDAQRASQVAGVELNAGGLFFPQGGWVNPPALCKALLQHPNIQLLACSEALQLAREDSSWQVLNDQGDVIAQAEIAVICAAADSQRFAPSTHLPLKRIRGQITHLPATEQSRALSTVLCSEGYVSPARRGEHHLGASFRFDRLDTEPSAEENQSNLALLESLSPALAAKLGSGLLQPDQLVARAALRCTTPDYLPVIGPLADADAFMRDYAVLSKDASKKPNQPTTWHPGLYVNAGHGSRGLISCPLSGEQIAAWIDGEPLPLPRELAHAVHPNRFLLRELIRGKRQK